MAQEPFIGAMLKMTSREIEQSMNARVTELGLTAAQSHILHYICMNSGRVHQRDVERQFGLTHATVSGIIDRLESKGFIRRERDPADGRVSALFAAEKAREYEEKVHAFILESEAQLLKDFTPEQEAALRGALDRILKNLDFDLQNNCPFKEAHPC